MKRMIGFIIFWIAIGMFIMFCLEKNIWAVLIIIASILLGYWLFCH